jgi:hypothetical protein
MPKNQSQNLSRWIVSGLLVAYGLKAGGWRRWAAFSLAGKLLGLAMNQERSSNGPLRVPRTRALQN